ncbi:MAG: HD domain-containing protein [Candidatus Methanomethylicus sp.]|nr:HD domain-containing protein [Candidatus Methanomethylicus sp.]
MTTFNLPIQENTKLKQIMEKVVLNPRLNTLWQVSNVTAISRLGYTDHGPIHVKIVANLALKILRSLIKRGVVPNVVKDYGMANNDAEVVVVLGAIFHDLGMAVIRKDHEFYSAMFAMTVLDEVLGDTYTPEEATIVTSEVLHAIVTHEEPQKPLTVEAGVVKIADALDMEKGRARIPFEAGSVDIHSVSALSIERVAVLEGIEKPVEVRILMTNPAGIFQIDQLLKPRIMNSGLQNYFHVVGEVVETDKGKYLERFEF